LKKLAVIGRKHSNIFFEIGNIPAVVKQENVFDELIKKNGYGFYLTLKTKNGTIIKKYPFYNEDHEALTEWIEVES